MLLDQIDVNEIAGARGGVGKCQFCLLSNFFKSLKVSKK